MTAISPLQTIHKKGLFGDHHKKDQKDLLNILELKNLVIVQIFKYKNHAYGIQLHIEIKSNTVSDWGCIPAYKNALEESLGPGALEKFEKIAKANMKDMNTYATILYNNFCKLM